MHERRQFDTFLPRSDSPFVFVLVVTCYDYALTSLFSAIVRLVHFPPYRPSFWESHGDPAAHVIEDLLFAPLIETCILVAVIEFLRWVRVPPVFQIFLAGSLLAWPHSFARDWGPYGFVVTPSFLIQAASYLYWKKVSRKRGFAVVASIHALSNLLPALYAIAHTTSKV